MSKTLRDRISKILATATLLASAGLNLMPNAGNTVFAMKEVETPLQSGDPFPMLNNSEDSKLVSNYYPVEVSDVSQYPGSMVINIPEKTRQELEQTYQTGQSFVPYIMGVAVPLAVLLALPFGFNISVR